MPEPVFNHEEVSVLRLSRLFSDMVLSEGWKEFEKVLKVQIADRERVLTIPISEKFQAFDGLDFTTRAAKVEVIKGAIIGLRLALELPTMTMNHAKDIMKEHSPGEPTNG